jgi:pre-60S factor REI1
MRTDWHRYNLKRRVALLPPLSAEIFAEKVLKAQASNSAAAAKASFEKTCSACQKTYYSENAYRNHLGSQRHRTNVTLLDDSRSVTDGVSVMSSTISVGEPLHLDVIERLDDPELEAELSKVVEGIQDTSLVAKSYVYRRTLRPRQKENNKNHQRTASRSSASSTDSEANSTPVPIGRCLFCSSEAPNLQLSIDHMTKLHGLFIPEQTYLTDLEGLIKYLQAKVTKNHECLACHKLKSTGEAVQTHMRDTGHCRIAFEKEEEMIEIGQFYDFRSTYSDEEELGSDSDDLAADAGNKRPDGAKLAVKRSGKSADGEGDQDGWETDSSAEGEDQQLSRLSNGAYSAQNAFYADDELHLPSGRTAGHRSLARYYRQNLHNYPSPEERVHQRMITAGGDTAGDADRDQTRGRQVMKRSEGGMLGLTDQKKREIQAVAQKQQRKAQRQQKQYQWGVEKRANNQTHFRDDNYGIRI